jgi:hypothetical protein
LLSDSRIAAAEEGICTFLMERRRAYAACGRYAVAIDEQTSRAWGFDFAIRLVSGLVAVLMESVTGDAAGAVHEDVYLNDQGLPLSLDKPVFSAAGCDHLSFNWVNDYTLQIHYEMLCVISQFTNRWFRPSDLAAGRLVRR